VESYLRRLIPKLAASRRSGLAARQLRRGFHRVVEVNNVPEFTSMVLNKRAEIYDTVSDFTVTHKAFIEALMRQSNRSKWMENGFS